MHAPQIHAALQLRLATEADCAALFEWRNHPVVRAASEQTAEIPWERHCEWFAAQLSQPDAVRLWIGEQNGQPVGVLRYVRNDNAADRMTVSIYLLASKIGQGLGFKLLQAGNATIWQTFPAVQQIEARIQFNNTASIRIFEKAGFQRRPESPESLSPSNSDPMNNPQVARYELKRND